jgi:hypothetical protein
MANRTNWDNLWPLSPALIQVEPVDFYRSAISKTSKAVKSLFIYC